jgi:hypothetical protein
MHSASPWEHERASAHTYRFIHVYVCTHMCSASPWGTSMVHVIGYVYVYVCMYVWDGSAVLGLCQNTENTSHRHKSTESKSMFVVIYYDHLHIGLLAPRRAAKNTLTRGATFSRSGKRSLGVSIHDIKIRLATASCKITDGQLPCFQRFCSSKIVLQNAESRSYKRALCYFSSRSTATCKRNKLAAG